MRRVALVVGLAVVAACAESPEPIDDTIDISRVASSVSVRRSRGGAELLHIDVDASAGRVVLTAAAGELALAIDAVATGPGVPITATVRAGAAVLEVRNDLVVRGDATYRLGEWQERNQLVAMLGPVVPALAAVAPYRTAIEARLAEAGPVFVAVGLFQAWPGGVEPAWPAPGDPRDAHPPGHLDGDLVGLGMTCSAAIRCPDSAPYCVTIDHAMTYGVCTRACASDAACVSDTGTGRCAQPVVDIPGVPDAVLTCQVDCVSGACPGLLACDAEVMTCGARQDSRPRLTVSR